MVSPMNENFEYPKDFDVYWEKWIDAYEQELEEEQQLLEQLIEEDLSDLDIDYEDIPKQYDKVAHVRSVMTPFGIIPLTEQSLASNHFKLWVGHSNFKILESHINVIGAVSGVESIDVLTPYRFRISVAKLFIDRDVMSDVRKALLYTL
tara:strand:- start:6904 stop:7350 length:447 start_codon:yes stop_codon:yes gene_type:complete